MHLFVVILCAILQIIIQFCSINQTFFIYLKTSYMVNRCIGNSSTSLFSEIPDFEMSTILSNKLYFLPILVIGVFDNTFCKRRICHNTFFSQYILPKNINYNLHVNVFSWV